MGQPWRVAHDCSPIGCGAQAGHLERVNSRAPHKNQALAKKLWERLGLVSIAGDTQ
ncbi:hypothetical protein GJV36_02695 [Pseudomonas sp. SDS3-8]|nr:hypothetical protein [Pseudomonas sp. SDS3-8]